MKTRLDHALPHASRRGRYGCLRFAAAWLASSLLLLLLTLAACHREASIGDIRRLQSMGRYEETIEPLRARLATTPDDPEIHFLYGTALSRSGAVRVAVWSLRKAAESPAWKVPATLELASTQSRAGNFEAAIEAAEAVLAEEPGNVEAHILRGESYLSQGEKPEKALEDFDFVLDQDPTSFAALTSKALALLMAGRVDEAAATIDALEEVTVDDPDQEQHQAQLCAVKAVLHQERQELDVAKKEIEACLDAFPAYGVVVDAAIGYFDAQGDRARSDAILTKALEIAPGLLAYRRVLAQRIAQGGDSARALAVLKEGLATDDPAMKSAVWTDVANFHVDRDELPEAIEAFEQALALVEDPPQLAILTHADLLARAGRHEDALRVAKGLTNDAYVGLIEARVALDRGDPKRALERLDEVFPVWPNNAGARYYAARAAEQLGDFKRAIEEYRQAVRSSPAETEAGLRLAKIYLAAGDNMSAWNAVSQYMASQHEDPESARVIVSTAVRDVGADLHPLFARLLKTPVIWPAAVSTRALFLAEQSSPEAALTWMDGLPGAKPDWTRPINAEALRTRVLLLRKAGRAKEADELVAKALAAHPDDSAFLEIKAALLEAGGGDPSAVRAGFEAAVAKDARNWLALEGMARACERAGDAKSALDYYDRSTRFHPESPDAAQRAAALAAERGDAADVEARWTALLREHPWNTRAAEALARIRSDRGQHDATTLDYAERAVMFGGGKEANALLVAVHEARGEHARAAEVAKALSEGKPIPLRNPKPGPGGGAPDEVARKSAS